MPETLSSQAKTYRESDDDAYRIPEEVSKPTAPEKIRVTVGNIKRTPSSTEVFAERRHVIGGRLARSAFVKALGWKW